MTTMTNRKPTIEETYRNHLSLAQNGIRYFVDRNGKHVVVHDVHCGEDIMPGVKRCDTIEEARVEWRRVRNLMVIRGYTERIK